MTGLLLGAAWGAAVLALAWWWRPPPSRVRALPRSGSPSAHPGAPVSAQRPARRSPSAVAGGALRRLALRRQPDARPIGHGDADAAAAADRRVGRAALSAVPAALVWPALAPLVALLVWAWPGVAAQRAERRRQAQAAEAMAEVVDLFALAIAAGLTVPWAVAAVGSRVGGPVGAGLRTAAQQAALGRRTADALDDLAADLEATRPLTSALAASERYGVALGPSLERLAAEERTERRRRAEEAARRIPVKLLFPLVLCTLPAFALLTVAPLIAGAFESLRL